MANWVDAKITKIHWWNKRLFSLYLTAPMQPYKAGQFTKLAIDIGGKRIARAYSFVNHSGASELEFYLIKVNDGSLSDPLSQRHINDTLQIATKASGFFTLDEVPPAKQLWMLATGTAIGPFLSILQECDVWHKFDKINLVHGVRLLEDLSYQNLIQSLCKTHSQLNYVSVVSQQDNVQGLNGRITHRLADQQLVKALNCQHAVSDSQFMICGNPNMVKDTVIYLEDNGYSRNRRNSPGQFTVEQYW